MICRPVLDPNGESGGGNALRGRASSADRAVSRARPVGLGPQLYDQLSWGQRLAGLKHGEVARVGVGGVVDAPTGTSGRDRQIVG
jgi:hypothetical protein